MKLTEIQPWRRSGARTPLQLGIVPGSGRAPSSKEQTMTIPTRSRTLRIPALALGALMGATALTAV
ncbi:MAG: hypothetical protein WBC03_02130, partial [Albidovulum sp.]